MNSLSWLLYLADILPNIAAGLLVVTCIIPVCLIVFGAMIADTSCSTESWKSYHTRNKRYLPLCLIGFFIALLIPSSETIYLIAGSEAGEAVITSPEGQEVLEILKEILKQKLESFKD